MASSSDDSGSEDEQYFSATDDESEDEDKKTINNSANAKKNSSSNPISKGKEGEEVEFIVKNLDTGESISSKEIDKKIMKGVDPKDLDPLSYNLLKRTSAPSEEVPRKRSIFNSVKAVKKFKKRKKATKKKLFAQICRQTIKQHTGSIWVMKFNYDGTLLATGGHDQKICIWQVVEEGNLITFLKHLFSNE